MSGRVFYAGVVEPDRPARLLLGPFQERGLAVAALEPARDLDYLVAGAARCPVPTRVRVVPLRVPDGVMAPTGELNAAAVGLVPLPGPPELPSITRSRPRFRRPLWLRRTT